MNPISACLVENIDIIFFLYGLAFFVMGLALALAQPRESRLEFSKAIRPLAAFGVLHGLHEWFEMFQNIEAQICSHIPTVGEEIARLMILGGSFLLLAGFGVILLNPQATSFWRRYWPVGALLVLWSSALLTVVAAFRPVPEQLIVLADVLMRYSLGIPATLLATWAMMRQQHAFRKAEMPQFGRHLVWCAAAMFLYGVVGQLFVRPSSLFPSTLINSVLFFDLFGIPVQLFRGGMAAIMTFYMVRVLRAFDLEGQQRLEQANQAKLVIQAAALEAERDFSQRLEQLNEELRLLYQEAQRRERQLGELLHQVVSAQETERKRVARELHDATGQSLTAMALGLSGIEAMVASGQPVGVEQVRELKAFGTQALGELRQLIADLRPPHLDDLGLVDALQWYILAFKKRYSIAVTFVIEGEPVRLSSEYETVLFRIAQEALTNVAKHARASQASVKLIIEPSQIQLAVEDDGQGFDPREIFGQEGRLTRWGLLGIGERTLILGGLYEIDSKPGAGTRISVKIPLNGTVKNDKDKAING
jgi:signal transduction histidine kinase